VSQTRAQALAAKDQPRTIAFMQAPPTARTHSRTHSRTHASLAPQAAWHEGKLPQTLFAPAALADVAREIKLGHDPAATAKPLNSTHAPGNSSSAADQSLADPADPICPDHRAASPPSAGPGGMKHAGAGTLPRGNARTPQQLWAEGGSGSDDEDEAGTFALGSRPCEERADGGAGKEESALSLALVEGGLRQRARRAASESRQSNSPGRRASDAASSGIARSDSDGRQARYYHPRFRRRRPLCSSHEPMDHFLVCRGDQPLLSGLGGLSRSHSQLDAGLKEAGQPRVGGRLGPAAAAGGGAALATAYGEAGEGNAVAKVRQASLSRPTDPCLTLARAPHLIQGRLPDGFFSLAPLDNYSRQPCPPAAAAGGAGGSEAAKAGQSDSERGGEASSSGPSASGPQAQLVCV
jgi:hypothetical protein